MSLTGFGGRSLVPDELLDGYGEDPALPDGWLIREGAPLKGLIVRHGFYPSPAVIQVHVGATVFPEQLRRLLIWQAAYDAVIGGIGRAALLGGLPHMGEGNPQFVFRWRPQGSSAPWNEVPGDVMGVSLSTADSTVTTGARVVGQVIIEDRRLDPAESVYDPGATDLPDTDDIIEFFLIGPIAPDEQHPVIVEGITAGQFAVNAYAGLYSMRDPITGTVVPTGIRYDEPSFAQMTDLVRIRLDKPIEDLRDWLEKHIYAPTGWVPALNSLGKISPVSQVAPVDATGLTVLTDAVTEPTPDWDAGQRVINVIRFTYPRDYIIGAPDPDPPYASEVRQNLIGQRDIILEFRDELSITRHGEQPLEISGEAFRAIGLVADAAAEETADPGAFQFSGQTKLSKFIIGVSGQATTELPIVRTAVLVLPVSGDVADETGYQLFLLRKIHVLNRYTLGAPAISIPVMRAFIPDHRCGDWVVLDLSWLPDYITQRRGLQTLAQIVALGDLDCGWRRLLVEQVIPVATS